MSSSPSNSRLILLTGASGYIGGRLLTALERAEWRVRCLARHPGYLQSRIGPSTEIVKGDCLDLPSLAPAMDGVHTAYYLVHSMGSSGKFEEEDRQAAQNFADAARAAGVHRIIYLGGLGDGDQQLSAHSAQSTGSRRHSSLVGNSDRRTARIHRDRLRKPVV